MRRKISKQKRALAIMTMLLFLEQRSDDWGKKKKINYPQKEKKMYLGKSYATIFML